MNFKTISEKKVLGIPVLYLALAAVVGFAIYAYKLKPTSSGGDSGDGDGEAGSGDAGGVDPYSGLATTGTVVVQPSAVPTTDKVEETNETWERAAINYLMGQNAGTPGAIQEAINTYLNGGDLTYEQGLLRDQALKKLGPPPEGFQLGKTGAKTPSTPASSPAQKQFTNFPGTHTVKGSNDNTTERLAILYYGNGGFDRKDKIASANLGLGPVGTTYSVGTKVVIPKWVNPRFVVTTSSMRTDTQVAAKNGTSKAVIQALNPNRTSPYPIGLKIRVE